MKSCVIESRFGSRGCCTIRSSRVQCRSLTAARWIRAARAPSSPTAAPAAAAGSASAAAAASNTTTSSSSSSMITSTSSSSSSLPGPSGAFAPGQEAATRQQLFNRIAPVYDELNDRLSLGQHRVWKRMAVRWARARPGARALDVCCGSGDLAFELAEAVGPEGAVTGLDFAAEMLDDAERRRAAAAAARPRARPLAAMEWVQGDALKLPFPDATFDAATMGYGLRNVADISGALAELRRVLKPGARAAVLDFNNAGAGGNALADWAQGLLLERVVVPAAAAYGLEDEYAYLRPSILRFPGAREQERLAIAAGFSSAAHYELGFGMMGCLVATK